MTQPLLLLLRAAALVALATEASASEAAATVHVAMDWSRVIANSSTAATVEVDVMPFLGRTSYGGPFDAYFEALSGLGAPYVRFAPWFPNPRVVVTELFASDCTPSRPATNWNSTLFDGVMRDFMAGVCGPRAETGHCKLSVIQQLSTMPSWMYVDGYCPDGNTSCLPANPWQTTNPFTAYKRSREALIDPTCGTMARYIARIVSHYTAGGHHDECGHWHASGLHYSWAGLSILNEDEHHIQPDNGQAYTQCFDAVIKEVRKVNRNIQGVGPEVAGASGAATSYLMYFLNSSHHSPPAEPEIASFHWDATASSGVSGNGSGGEAFLLAWERALYDPAGSVQRVQALKAAKGLRTKMLLNEFIPFVDDWCELAGTNMTRCPNWQSPTSAGSDPDLQHGKGVGMNRRTYSWNAAGAVFALGFATLAHYDYLAVGQDQLIGGTFSREPLPHSSDLQLELIESKIVDALRCCTWPDNEPAVSCLDWQTGQPNAKYWVTQLLAKTVGRPITKQIVAHNITGVNHTKHSSNVPCVLGVQFGGGDVGVANLTVAMAVERCRMMDKCAGFTSMSAADPNACPASNARVFEMHFKDGWGVKNGRRAKGSTSWPLPPPTLPPSSAVPIYVLPYLVGSNKGVLLINKKAVRTNVHFSDGAISSEVATIVEVDETSAEPGFAPPLARPIVSGRLSMGPFAVAVIELDRDGK